jgi:hypothetical protein
MRSRLFDRILLVCFFVLLVNAVWLNAWALTNFAEGTSVGARLLAHYGQWDPLFLHPPLWMRFSFAAGTVLFGPIFVAAIVAFWRRRGEWIRPWILLYAGGATFELLQYFALEVINNLPGTNFAVVFAANGPWLLVPIAAAVRVWRTPVFEPGPGGPAPMA